MGIQIKGNLATLPGRRKCEPEHALFFAILEQAVVDAKSPSIDDVRLDALLRHVSSPWVKKICDWVDFDHEYFVECIEKTVDKTREERQKFRLEREKRLRRKALEKKRRKTVRMKRRKRRRR